MLRSFASTDPTAAPPLPPIPCTHTTVGQTHIKSSTHIQKGDAPAGLGLAIAAQWTFANPPTLVNAVAGLTRHPCLDRPKKNILFFLRLLDWRFVGLTRHCAAMASPSPVGRGCLNESAYRRTRHASVKGGITHNASVKSGNCHLRACGDPCLSRHRANLAIQFPPSRE